MSLVVFYGTVMRGQPNHASLEGAAFVSEVATARRYRLFSIRDEHPALVEDDAHGVSIAGELYEVPDDVWQGILDSEPPGLHPGRVELADGREAEAVLGDEELVGQPGAADISRHGGWVAYLGSRA